LIDTAEFHMRGQVWARAGFPVLGNFSYPTIIAALSVVTTLSTSSAEAGEKSDSEHLFGFTEGSDIGSKGEREFKNETTFRTGKAAGSFAAGTSEAELKYTLSDNVRVSTAATLAYFDIHGVPGLGDANRGAIQSASFSARFRLLERDKAPVGMTFSIEPHWGFVDETKGLRIGHFGTEAAILMDRELIPHRLMAALNIQFENDRVRSVAPGALQHESILGSGLALTAQLSSGLWFGGEVRYLRSYEGAALDVFSGQAVYVGPTAFVSLPNNYWLSAAVNIQVWGRAAGTADSLDLTNFERYQAKLRVGFSF
jgi:hypothetical protein